MTHAEQDLSQHLQEGFEALNRGDLNVAAKACKSALSQCPDLAPAHFLVGLVAVEGDERRVAHAAFKSVLLAPYRSEAIPSSDSPSVIPS